MSRIREVISGILVNPRALGLLAVVGLILPVVIAYGDDVWDLVFPPRGAQAWIDSLPTDTCGPLVKGRSRGVPSGQSGYPPPPELYLVAISESEPDGRVLQPVVVNDDDTWNAPVYIYGCGPGVAAQWKICAIVTEAPLNIGERPNPSIRILWRDSKCPTIVAPDSAENYDSSEYRGPPEPTRTARTTQAATLSSTPQTVATTDPFAAACPMPAEGGVSLDIGGRWQYLGDVGYFTFTLQTVSTDGSTTYAYEEYTGEDVFTGQGTATVTGSNVRMGGFDSISDYVWDLVPSPDLTVLKGCKTHTSPFLSLPLEIGITRVE